jgi:prepilin-type N-terminal cleavage/methylation domain-containing protein
MNKQTGFTLIELAIVLVIIGLLLGGVLRGQELINSAKVKNMARDFQNVQVYVYGYQDKYKALPGDDVAAQAHVGSSSVTALQSTTGAGNGVIGGAWDAGANGTVPNAESGMFWQHVRLAGLAPGPTGPADGNYYPTNADGGRIGIQSLSGSSNLPSSPSSMSGAFVVCSGGILGKFAKQIDTTLDDSNTATGSVRAYASASGSTTATWVASTGTTGLIDDSTPYNVCMAF